MFDFHESGCLRRNRLKMFPEISIKVFTRLGVIIKIEKFKVFKLDKFRIFCAAAMKKLQKKTVL